MKKIKNIKITYLKCSCFALVLLLCINSSGVFAQDTATAQVVKKVKPVKGTFGSVWLIDNQTVMVPIKGTLEFDIQHRFGIVNNGSKDLWGFFAPSNIRLGLNYPLSITYLWVPV